MTDHSMQDDVLAPFMEEWAERARRAQQAIADLTSGARKSRAPRIERRRSKGEDHYVLVRRDGDEARLLDPEAHEVTVWFSPDEWAMITRVVFLQHGLTTLQVEVPAVPDEQEGPE